MILYWTRKWPALKGRSRVVRWFDRFRRTLTPIGKVLPSTAPNGAPWPHTGNYIPGYPRLNVFGEADITADNSGASSDVFVKLPVWRQANAARNYLALAERRSAMEYARGKISLAGQVIQDSGLPAESFVNYF
jgi:hypothetical protein